MGFFLSCVCYVFVCVCLYVLCGHLLGKIDLLALVCGVLLRVCHFTIGILGQVGYLIVSIPDLCTLIHFYNNAFRLSHTIHAISHYFIMIEIISLNWSLTGGLRLCLWYFLIILTSIYKLNCHKLLALLCLVAEEFSSQHCIERSTLCVFGTIEKNDL